MQEISPEEKIFEEKLLALIDEQIKKDVAAIRKTPEGRRFLWALLEEAEPFKDVFTGNSATFLKEGRRQIGIWVMSHFERMGILDELRLEYQKSLPALEQRAKKEMGEENGSVN